MTIDYDYDYDYDYVTCICYMSMSIALSADYIGLINLIYNLQSKYILLNYNYNYDILTVYDQTMTMTVYDIYDLCIFFHDTLYVVIKASVA